MIFVPKQRVRMADPGISVRVVYATPVSVFERMMNLPKGSVVADAIEASGIGNVFAEALKPPFALGIFSRPANPDTVLQDGDRVEIYRPLQADPKTARRRRAAQKPSSRA